MDMTDQVGEWIALLENRIEAEKHPWRKKKLTEIRDALPRLRAAAERGQPVAPYAWAVEWVDGSKSLFEKEPRRFEETACIVPLYRGARAPGAPGWRDVSNERTLCYISGYEAVGGACPVHGGDSCLRQYAPVAPLPPSSGSAAPEGE